MKNLKIVIAVSAFIALFLNGPVHAQKEKSFEGVIIYEMTIDSDDLDPMAKALFANMEQITFIKNEKSRTDQNLGVTKSITISDSKNKTVVTLTEIMGQKFRINAKAEDLKKQEADAKKNKIVYLEDTKTIAGYNCRKALIQTSEDAEPIIIYYTNEIPVIQYGSVVKGIDGFPLEYETSMGGYKITAIAKSVKKEKIPDSKFEIPEGYQETTAEELQKIFGGGK